MKRHASHAIAAAVLLAPLSVSAEMFGSDYKPCAGKPSTLAIVECVQAKTKSWDDRLNAAYKDLMKRIRPDQRQALISAQQLWIQYRGANCEFYYTAESTIRQVQAAECLQPMTQDRTLELEEAMKLGN